MPLPQFWPTAHGGCAWLWVAVGGCVVSAVDTDTTDQSVGSHEGGYALWVLWVGWEVSVRQWLGGRDSSGAVAGDWCERSVPLAGGRRWDGKQRHAGCRGCGCPAQRRGSTRGIHGVGSILKVRGGPGTSEWGSVRRISRVCSLQSLGGLE